MPEQKLMVPVCPRRENGHLWRFDRARSTGDCQANLCQGCGLGAADVVSNGTGGALRGFGSGRRRRMNGSRGRIEVASNGRVTAC